jgi:hypothetical protein
MLRDVNLSMVLPFGFRLGDDFIAPYLLPEAAISIIGESTGSKIPLAASADFQNH